MNNSNASQNTIDIQQIKPLIYDSAFGHLNVYSRQYFSAIISSMFHTINRNQPFCLTYGDFNGLGNINIKHGHQAGDFAVEEALKVIRDTMPANTLICRIAGDEFAFITPDKTGADIQPYINTIYSILNRNKEKIYGLSITLKSADNTTFKNSSSTYAYFDHLYITAEILVEREKQKSKQNNLSPVDVLKDKSIIATKRFFDYYRFDNDNIEENFAIALRDKLQEIAESKDENSQLDSQNITPEDTLHLKFMINPDPTFPIDIATDIHTALTTEKPGINLPNEIKEKLFNNLITHPLTGLYSQKYFEKVLGPAFVNGESKNLTIHLFDIMHMKLSNDLSGHSSTDENMKKIIDIIKKYFSEKNPNAIFIMNGGTFLIIEEESETAFPDKNSSSNSAYPVNISELINLAVEGQKYLNLAHSSTTCLSQDLFAGIENLKIKINVIKKEIKSQKIKDPETLHLALNTALSDVFNYYFTHFNGPDSKQNITNILLPTIRTALSITGNETLEINSRKPNNSR